VPLLSATALAGSIYLSTGTHLHATSLTATMGNVSIIGALDLTLDSVTAGTASGATGTIFVQSSTAALTLGTLSSSGSQILHADGDIGLTSVTAAGSSSDAGDVHATSDHGAITGGSIAANGSVTLIAATTNIGDALTATQGAVVLQAAGLIDWSTLTAGTTLGATSSNDSVTLKTATSGGTQTLHANQNVTFNQVTASGAGGDPGSVIVSADHGFVLAQTVLVNGAVTEGSVVAHGSASLTAGTTNTGNTLTATTGAASLAAGGPINWTTLIAGTTLGATSTAGSIAFDTAQSGGTQTLHANQNVTFNQITTLGLLGDAGSVNVTSDLGAISGGSINAHGSANLVAAANNTGINLTTVTGAAFLQAGGQVDWKNLNVYGSLGIISASGGITLGTAISGGTQILHAADDIVFKQLSTTGMPGDAGDIDLISAHGSVRGGSIFANGDIHLNANNAISLDQLRGSVIGLATPQDLTVNFVSVVRELDLAANTINVTAKQIPSVPSIPLVMNVTGFNGGIASSANLVIDPDAIFVNQFRVVDANFVANAPLITIVNGDVPGQLMLTTPTERVLLDNRSPGPSAWPTLQLYQPGGVFTLTQNVNANFTDSYVVFYSGDIASTVSTYSADHACCTDFTGSSMVRNVPNDMMRDAETNYLVGLTGGSGGATFQIPKSVDTVGPGPAVNIEGLSEARKFRRFQNESRDRPRWRSGELRRKTNLSSVDQVANVQ
jgi:hypothetical protein